MSKILVISTSPRKSGNSETLADAFAKGALEAGHSVEKISLYDKAIGFCRGCLACQSTKRCVIRDDADVIAQKMRTADVLVFATPIYYYEMSGQMKTIIDRANSLYESDYAFRDVYFLSSAAENEEGTDSRAIQGLEGWIACYERAQLKGTVFAGGVTGIGEMEGHPALKKAYDMGSAIQ